MDLGSAARWIGIGTGLAGHPVHQDFRVKRRRAGAIFDFGGRHRGVASEPMRIRRSRSLNEGRDTVVIAVHGAAISRTRVIAV